MAGNNIFPRYTGGKINIEGRVGQGGGGSTPTDVFTVFLWLRPELLTAIGEATQASVILAKNNISMGDQIVDLTTTDQNIALVPSQVISATDGVARFSLIGRGLGSANIQASINIEGQIILSNVVTLSVVEVEAPEDYTATGYGRIKFTVEPSLANALYPRPRRLSHQELHHAYFGDTGLILAHFYATAEVTFTPKYLLMKK